MDGSFYYYRHPQRFRRGLAETLSCSGPRRQQRKKNGQWLSSTHFRPLGKSSGFSTLRGWPAREYFSCDLDNGLPGFLVTTKIDIGTLDRLGSLIQYKAASDIHNGK